MRSAVDEALAAYYNRDPDALRIVIEKLEAKNECGLCGAKTSQVLGRNELFECSHVDCPHRKADVTALAEGAQGRPGVLAEDRATR